MSGDAASYRRQVQARSAGVVQMPSGAGSMQALSAGLDRLASSFGAIASDAHQQDVRNEALRAEEEARDDLGRLRFTDDDGNVQFHDRRDPTAPGSRLYNRGLEQFEADAMEANARDRMTQLRADPEAARDPFRVAAHWSTYAQRTLAATPENRQAFVASTLARIGGDGINGVRLATGTEIRQQQNALWSSQRQAEDDELYGMVDANATSGPAWDGLLERRGQRIQAGVRAGYILPEAASLIEGTTADQVGALRIARDVERVARDQGPQAARRALSGILDGEGSGALGMRARNVAEAEGLRRIGTVEQDQRFRQGELGSSLDTALANVRAGVLAPADRLEAMAREADSAGIPAQGRRFRALAQVQGEVASTSRMALPEMMEAVGRATRADLSDPAAGMRLQEFERLRDERVKALRDDPVGWADTTPQVLDVRRRVNAGTATAQDLVRARDAALTANGLPPEFTRVMSGGEARKVVQDLKNAPIDQATASLTSTLATFGPGNRWRAWNDLRAAGLDENLRPVALLLTSPGGAATAMNYVAAVREGPEALSRPLTEDTRRSVGEYVAAGMATVRPTFTGTGADADLANDLERGVGTLAMFYARTMPAKDAAARAQREMVDGSVEVVSWGAARLRIPRGAQFDRPQFRAALDAMAGSLDEVQLRIPDGAVSPDLTPEQAQAAYRASLRAASSWRTAQDGMGAALHDSQGTPVTILRGGQEVPFRLRFDETNFRDPGVLRQGGNYAVARTAAAARGLDVTWVARLTGAESAGRVDAVSPKGALGLMQVMPDTAREVAGKLGIPFDRDRLLTDPAYNAQIGTAYLDELNRDPRLGGDRTLVTAAYNAGPNRIAAWLDGGRESLPAETVAYVGKVLGGNGMTLLTQARAARARPVAAALPPAGVDREPPLTVARR